MYNDEMDVQIEDQHTQLNAEEYEPQDDFDYNYDQYFDEYEFYYYYDDDDDSYWYDN